MINDEDYRALVAISNDMINDSTLTTHRYLYDMIDWSARLICIRGAKGTGKTTMLLQYITEHYPERQKVLYVSLDDFHFQLFSVYDVAEYAYTHGVEALFIDEVHYQKHWSQYIKNIYDRFKNLKIVYTGSSMLQLTKADADLSRRQSVYDLWGFSFREYLLFSGKLQMDAVSLPTILIDHTKIANEVRKSIRPLELFDQYLFEGNYPFCLEGAKDYHKRLLSVVDLTIFQDIPMVEDISFSTLQKARKLLMILAEQVPFEPNISTLCRDIEATRDIVIKLLDLLEKAGLLMLLQKEKNNYKTLSRPDKIYLNNTNLMYALNRKTNKGTMRETFFYNQLRNTHSVLIPQKGDFIIDSKYVFEVGGEGKDFTQIKDLSYSYLAVDNTEYGFKNRIPLWLFGFLY